MLLQYREKITVEGIEVYPDFDNPNQFWYIPTQLKLAERNNDKILSYLWYIASTDDKYGNGFLNFEVNTKVEDSTLNNIKSAITTKWGVNQKDIALGRPTYTSGTVSFVALKPLGENDRSQSVWNAGSPSLVGDNTSVCSVEFTPEGKLAAAMVAAIEDKRNTLMAVYTLKYKAMTPAITFRVKGDFQAFLEDFKVSAGLPIPLKGFILNLGIQNEFQASWDKKDLKIELVNYVGDDASTATAIEWAKKVVFDYMLKNFFEYRLKPSDSWSPLSEKPEISKTISDANKAGSETDKTEEAKETAAKAVSAAVPAVSINLNVSNFTGLQKSELDFMYTESRAQEFTVAPQSAVLEGLKNPDKYITQINRRDFPFGQLFNVQVGGPGTSSALFSDSKLNTAKVNVNYPANGAAFDDLTFTATGTTGDNPLKFQYNQDGDTKVGYSISYIFEPANDWMADDNQYEIKNVETETNTIDAFPGNILEFFEISIRIAGNFIWGDTKRVDVEISCDGYSKPIIRSFFPDNKDEQSAKIRVDKRKFPNATCRYSYKLLDGQNNVIYQSEKQLVNNSMINVSDQYQEHVPITFYNHLAVAEDIEMAIVTVHYEGKNDYSWDSGHIEFDSGRSPKSIQVILPTLAKYPDKKEITFSYTIQVIKTDGSQDRFEMSGLNPTQVVFVTGVKPS